MAKNPTVIYPDSAPAWLAHWPTESDIRSMFPEGVRRVAYRLMVAERRKTLSWDERRLVLDIGNQQVTWRLRGETWRRSCSCGYINDRCPHAYISACLLNEILRHEKWGTREVAPGSSPIRRETDHSKAAVAQAETEPRAAANQARSHDRSPARIEVEADFHHEPDTVALRFYRRTGDRRELLRMQTVATLAKRARAGTTSTHWSYDDWRFLKWLSAQMKRRPEVRANLQVLKLSRRQFDLWLDRWQSVAGRFIERASQQQIGPRGRQPASLVFELRPEKEWVRIAAVLLLPSGRREPFHDVFQQLAAGGQDSVVSGEILQFTPPVSGDLLTRVFSKKDPRMRREHICEHLPNLLEGRIDLLEGPAVRRRHATGEKVRLTASQDGADIVLTASVGGQPVTMDGSISGNMVLERGTFVVTIYETPGIQAVRDMISDLDATAEGKGRYRVQGSTGQVAALRESWQHLPDSVVRKTHPELKQALGEPGRLRAALAVQETRNFVDVSVAWECGHAVIDHDAVARALLVGRSIVRSRDGQWLAIDPARAADALKRLQEQGFDPQGAQRFFRTDAAERMKALDAERSDVTFAGPSRSLAERIVAEDEVRTLPLPEALDGVLRHYQKQGFEFLADRVAHGVGAILADDMGLGKTVQLLALLLAWSERKRRDANHLQALVVCPASVVGVWVEQAAQFTPTLRCAAAIGPPEQRVELQTSSEWDVLVTNYALLRMDADVYTDMSFDAVVLDEAQAIKNPEAQVTRVAKSLDTGQALALTGTPLENRLLDLWSIMDFLNPGFLGTADDFTQRYRDDSDTRQTLADLVAPVILRRTKEAVAPELPPRTDEVITVEMTDEQRDVYDRELIRARETVRSQGPMHMLAALTRLRRICCHSGLVSDEGDGGTSGKLETLVEMLSELAEEGHSALVFSQFTTMLDRIQPVLQEAGLSTMMLTGRTPTAKRAELVRQFSEASDPRVFLLSLRAAGTGLTLTKAGYVFIFDPWWNPAVERQAIDRTHRIGQQKAVFAYRLVTANSVEEKVLRLQRQKAALFAEVMGEAEERRMVQGLTADDIRTLLS